jgi:cytochrome b6-f complex iron-sulfur subunit
VNIRGSRRFVEDLLRGNRPRPFPAEQADVEELRTAITLRAARPGSGAPREQFVTDPSLASSVAPGADSFRAPGSRPPRRRSALRSTMW